MIDNINLFLHKTLNKSTRPTYLTCCGFVFILLSVLPHSTLRQKPKQLSISAALPAPPPTSTPSFTPAPPVAAVAPASVPWQTVTIRSGETLGKIFLRLGIPKPTLNAVLHADAKERHLTRLRPNQKLTIQLGPQKKLLALQLQANLQLTVNIDYCPANNTYRCHYHKREIVTRVAYSSNSINGSLFAAGQAVKLQDKMMLQFAEIFSWDIDFAMDLRKNDRFQVLFEEKYIDNKKIGVGNILMAEFVNQGKVYRAIRFTDKYGRTSYYSPEGFGMQKAFLRTPVKFSRISSHFSNSRYHPLLHRMRAHKGVDYAAPAGTPVKATADGEVVFVGTKNGYGKSIELRHGNKYSTFYAHLSRFSKELRRGRYVRQGDVIGYVGRTGLATNDHLHYEFRVDGMHRDPLTVKLPKSLPIDKRVQQEFRQQVMLMTAMLKKHTKTVTPVTEPPHG
jgi:murein DD-endopeptidase MepM/ murein hydrolase activator NlpD